MPTNHRPCPFCDHAQVQVRIFEEPNNDYYAAVCLNCDSHGPFCINRPEAWRRWDNEHEIHIFTVKAESGMKCVCGEWQKRKRIPRAWVLEALDRQGGLCSIGGEPLHINDAVGDHKIPLNPRQMGDPVGKHNKWNIAAACRVHNSEKSNRAPLAESKRTGRLLSEII